MSWGRIDDKLHVNPKFAEVHNPSHPVSVWLHVLSWALEDTARKRPGFVPTVIARRYGTPGALKKLVSAGLWIEVDGGFELHDFARYAERNAGQDPDELRAKRAQAGRLGGLARVAKQQAKQTEATDQANASSNDKQNKAHASAGARACVPDPDPVTDPRSQTLSSPQTRERDQGVDHASSRGPAPLGELLALASGGSPR